MKKANSPSRRKALRKSADTQSPTAGASAEAAPAAGSRPAAPGQDYLAKRAKVSGQELPLSIIHGLRLNMPGVGLEDTFDHQVLLRDMTRPIYFESESIMRYCSEQAGSAFEAVELGQVVQISYELEDNTKQSEEGPFTFSGWYPSFRKPKPTGQLLLFCAFVIYHHAEGISACVLPSLEKEAMDEACYLAAALVIAERVMFEMGVVAELGSLAVPTKLQEQAWRLHERYWNDGHWKIEHEREDSDAAREKATRFGLAQAGRGPSVAA